MQRTKIIETQETLSNTAGSASSISSATCVRICNASSSALVVGMTTAVGAGNTFYFTVPQYSVEFLQKYPGDVIWATSGTITANKVGFTN